MAPKLSNDFRIWTYFWPKYFDLPTETQRGADFGSTFNKDFECSFLYKRPIIWNLEVLRYILWCQKSGFAKYEKQIFLIRGLFTSFGHSVPQCWNMRNFLPFWLYVKSILADFEARKLQDLNGFFCEYGNFGPSKIQHPLLLQFQRIQTMGFTKISSKNTI